VAQPAAAGEVAEGPLLGLLHREDQVVPDEHEQLVHGRIRAENREAAAPVTQPAIGLEQDGQRGGVEEGGLGQIDQEALPRLARQLAELLLDLGGHADVRLAANAYARDP